MAPFILFACAWALLACLMGWRATTGLLFVLLLIPLGVLVALGELAGDVAEWIRS